MAVGNYEAVHGNQIIAVTTPGTHIFQVAAPTGKKILSAGLGGGYEGMSEVDSSGDTATIRVFGLSSGNQSVSYWLTAAEMC